MIGVVNFSGSPVKVVVKVLLVKTFLPQPFALQYLALAKFQGLNFSFVWVAHYCVESNAYSKLS